MKGATPASAEASPGGDPKGKRPRPSRLRLFFVFLFDAAVCLLAAAVLGSVSESRDVFWISTFSLFFFVRAMGRFTMFPTPGELIGGVRYLTSSSRQVMVDIQVVDLEKTPPPVLAALAGVDILLGFFFLCGWAFLPGAVLFGEVLSGKSTWFFFAGAGFSFFWAGAEVLCLFPSALRLVPLVHAAWCLEMTLSFPAWRRVFNGGASFAVPAFLAFLYLYSLFLVLQLRRHRNRFQGK